MRVDIFDYDLPVEKIATSPARPRDASRLLDLTGGKLADKTILDLPGIFQPNDLLVINDTRVIPSRLKGLRDSVKIEITLHKQIENGIWAAFARPAKRLKQGDKIVFNSTFKATVQSRNAGEVILDFQSDDQTILDELHKIGRMPLPPYIKRSELSKSELDQQDYQSVFAKRLGAVAAPTASLHFTPALLNEIKLQGVKQVNITLHVGAGTFLPVTASDSDDHKMHSEWAELTNDAISLIKETKKSGGRIIALGTTVLRVLESAALNGELRAFSGETDLFITPGFTFRVVDLLLTNFHQPRSTLIMLVAAFAGTNRILEAYEYAKNNGYRFLSYGDACLIENMNKV
ncbi:tRNA preQ1(34) S-adenosylmethionine ribosyltransferase-isomerase QueA [Alphaproteobacteria bacterium]|jgi:S-adenosylmethionine:tRNA ribosyltransferase-isomerase|nr:tRNA preQ1(34) S-adenosylmethionine ribosyltransferase-isomerase QueA [Alphaproteobacteria bacterium]|tara:strand:- start:364 stop:1401 length:1038 start_codon:yes stop_codon:yes gene_type:complete